MTPPTRTCFAGRGARLLSALASVAVLGLLGCGGGGGGGGIRGGAPRATLAWPPPGVMTDAAFLEVTGTASGPRGVSAVSVNGIPAALTAGDPVRWQVRIPLAVGDNPLVVDVTDGLGVTRSAVDQGSVQRRSLLLSPVAVTGAGNSAPLLDAASSAVFQLDLSGGGLDLLHGPPASGDPQMSDPIDLAVLSGGDLVLVDRALARLIRVDAATGARTALEGPGLAFTEPVGIALVDDRTAAVVDAGSAQVFLVDLVTGERRPVVDPVGDVQLLRPRDVLFDPAFDPSSLYVVDSGVEGLRPGFVARIFLGDGTHEYFSGEGIGQVEGDDLGGDSELLYPAAVTSDGTRLFVADLKGTIVEISPSGDRRWLAALELSRAPDLGRRTDLCWIGGASLLVVDRHAGTVASLDTASGASQVLAMSTGSGSGPAFLGPSSLVLDAAGERLLVADGEPANREAIYAVAGASGDRSLISGAGRGRGDDFGGLSGLALDEAGGRLFAVAEGKARPYRIAGPARDLDPDSWGWDPAGDQFLGALRAALREPSHFGERGPVPREIETLVLETVDAAALADVDAFLVPYWSDDEFSDRAADVLQEFFLGGGDLVLLSDQSQYDKLGKRLGLPTLDGISDTVIRGGAPLFSGPFGSAAEVELAGIIGQLDAAAVLARGGTIAASTDLGEVVTALFEPGAYAPGAGRLLILTDTDVLSTFGEANYTPENDNATFALNAFAWLLGADLRPPSAVFRVDLFTGDRTRLSDADHGGGPDFERAVRAAYDAGAGRLLVVDAALGLFEVDPENGQRTLVSGAGRGGGRPFLQPVAAVLDPAGNLAYVLDSEAQAVFGVNLGSGDRWVISESGDGGGEDFVLPRGLARFPAANALAVADAQAVFAIDLETGARQVLSDFEQGGGARFEGALDLRIEGANAWLLDRGTRSVFALEAAFSGDRALWSR